MEELYAVLYMINRDRAMDKSLFEDLDNAVFKNLVEAVKVRAGIRFESLEAWDDLLKHEVEHLIKEFIYAAMTFDDFESVVEFVDKEFGKTVNRKCSQIVILRMED